MLTVYLLSLFSHDFYSSSVDSDVDISKIQDEEKDLNLKVPNISILNHDDIHLDDVKIEIENNSKYIRTCNCSKCPNIIIDDKTIESFFDFKGDNNFNALIDNQMYAITRYKDTIIIRSSFNAAVYTIKKRNIIYKSIHLSQDVNILKALSYTYQCQIQDTTIKNLEDIFYSKSIDHKDIKQIMEAFIFLGEGVSMFSASGINSQKIQEIIWNFIDSLSGTYEKLKQASDNLAELFDNTFAHVRKDYKNYIHMTQFVKNLDPSITGKQLVNVLKDVADIYFKDHTDKEIFKYQLPITIKNEQFYEFYKRCNDRIFELNKEIYNNNKDIQDAKNAFIDKVKKNPTDDIIDLQYNNNQDIQNAENAFIDPLKKNPTDDIIDLHKSAIIEEKEVINRDEIDLSIFNKEIHMLDSNYFSNDSNYFSNVKFSDNKIFMNNISPSNLRFKFQLEPNNSKKLLTIVENSNQYKIDNINTNEKKSISHIIEQFSEKDRSLFLSMKEYYDNLNIQVFERISLYYLYGVQLMNKEMCTYIEDFYSFYKYILSNEFKSFLTQLHLIDDSNIKNDNIFQNQNSVKLYDNNFWRFYFGQNIENELYSRFHLYINDVIEDNKHTFKITKFAIKLSQIQDDINNIDVNNHKIIQNKEDYDLYNTYQLKYDISPKSEFIKKHNKLCYEQYLKQKNKAFIEMENNLYNISTIFFECSRILFVIYNDMEEFNEEEKKPFKYNIDIKISDIIEQNTMGIVSVNSRQYKIDFINDVQNIINNCFDYLDTLNINTDKFRKNFIQLNQDTYKECENIISSLFKIMYDVESSRILLL